MVSPGEVVDLDDPDTRFSRVPWEGRLFVDEVAFGAWQLTDIWTGAHASLQGHDFELCFVDDDGLLVNNSLQSHREIGPLLGRDLVLTADGECALCSVDVDGVITQTSSFDNVKTQYEPGMAHISVSRCRAEVKCGVSIFKAARPGRMRAFWNLHDIYSNLQLSSYAKVPSRWVYNSKKPWGTLFKALFFVLLLLSMYWCCSCCCYCCLQCSCCCDCVSWYGCCC